MLEPLLTRVRALPRVREPKWGVFYHGGDGLLHFHEDPAGLFADVKVDGRWQRLPAVTPTDWDAVMAALTAAAPAKAEQGSRSGRAGR